MDVLFLFFWYQTIKTRNWNLYALNFMMKISYHKSLRSWFGKAISEYGFGLEIVWSRPEIKKAHQAHRLYGDGIFVLLLRFHRVESTLSATNRAANNASFQSFVARTARLQSANLGFLTLSKFEGKKASHPPVSGPKSLIGKWLPS